ncbi:hypothetical protein M3194_02270 [Paenibacillus glycanilyticus]|uniref:Ger(x)C family spore germination C-terminal domain-containing protein n=1 Tax=Paenibacillus glycanilyticus TaxID=126569 RepID=UPI00203C0A70|nr:Ger(x)C family spore germination C-terminal domain-containing protein [Paenibacillus glycanilyticus]MCM3626192.1 hypothetical protein [Paenibacillus glycanilyticus]
MRSELDIVLRDAQASRRMYLAVVDGKAKEVLEKSFSSEKFQTEGIDPLGLGDFVRSKTRNWNEEKWKREYGLLNVKVNVKMEIEETGITQ